MFRGLLTNAYNAYKLLPVEKKSSITSAPCPKGWLERIGSATFGLLLVGLSQLFQLAMEQKIISVGIVRSQAAKACSS